MTTAVTGSMYADDGNGHGSNDGHVGGDDNGGSNDVVIESGHGHDHTKDHDPGEGTNCSQVCNGLTHASLPSTYCWGL